jgi:hypothetical protein
MKGEVRFFFFFAEKYSLKHKMHREMLDLLTFSKERSNKQKHLLTI